MQRFNKKTSSALILSAFLLPCAAQAQMPDFSDLQVTVGAKMWNTKWSTWFPELQLQGVFLGGDRFRIDFANANIFNRDSDTRTAFIPQLSMRAGSWLVSGSAFTEQTYKFKLNTAVPLGFDNAGDLIDVELKRKEYDLNFGYYVSPNVALVLGYKDWRNNSPDSSYQFQGKGPTIGATVSTPVGAGLNFYGNFAYGFPKVKTNASIPLDSAGGTDSFGGEKRGDYRLGEVGLAYPLGQASDSLKGLTVALGYRYQKLASADVTLPTYFVGGDGRLTQLSSREVKLIDTTEGFTLGIFYTF